MTVSKNYVLDTSAVIAFIHNERGSDVIQEIFNDAQKRTARAYASFVTFTEIYYIIWRHKGEESAKDVMVIMEAMPLECVHSNDQLSLNAGRIKANYRLSLADAFVAATAIEKNAILVHKDPEMASMQKYVETVQLPYKK